MTGDNESVDDFLARCDDVIDDWNGSGDSASWAGDGSHEYDTGGEYYSADQMWGSSTFPSGSLDPLQFVHTDAGNNPGDDRQDSDVPPRLLVMTHRLSDLADPGASTRRHSPFIGFGRTPAGFDEPVYAPDPYDQLRHRLISGPRRGPTAGSWERLIDLASDFSEEADGQLQEDVGEDGSLLIWVTTSPDDSARAGLAMLERARQYAAEHGGEANFRISYVTNFGNRDHVTVAGIVTPEPGSTHSESDAAEPPFMRLGGTPGVRQRVLYLLDECYALAQAASQCGVAPASDDSDSETSTVVDDSRTPRPRRHGRQAQESPYGPPSRRTS